MGLAKNNHRGETLVSGTECTGMGIVFSVLFF